MSNYVCMYGKPLYVGSRQKIQIPEEASAKGLQTQPPKDTTVKEEVFDSLQLLLIASYPAIVRQGSVPNPCQ